MRQIRLGIFETNSSSTHSIVICTDEEFEKWKNGELVYDGDKSLIPSTEDNPEYGDSYGNNYDEFGEYAEVCHTEYTTESGDKINIICRYGQEW